MDKDAREFLLELQQEIRDIRKDVQDLLLWKNKVMGIFIAVSAILTFCTNFIRNHFGI